MGGIVSKQSSSYFYYVVQFQLRLGLPIGISGDDTKLFQSFLGCRPHFVIKEICRQNTAFISIVFASF